MFSFLAAVSQNKWLNFDRLISHCLNFVGAVELHFFMFKVDYSAVAIAPILGKRVIQIVPLTKIYLL